MGLGTTEIILIVAILVLLFGASKIPELARGVGQGINEFKKATDKEIEGDKNKSENTSGSTTNQTDKESAQKS